MKSDLRGTYAPWAFLIVPHCPNCLRILPRCGIVFLKLQATPWQWAGGCLAVQVWPLTDVKEYMGHADLSTTLIYVHHRPQHDAAAKLSRLVTETLASPMGNASTTIEPAETFSA